MGAEVLPSDAEHPFLRIGLQDRVVNTNLVGSYNADNVMAAIAVGQHFGVSLEEAVAAVEAYVPSNNRSQMTRTEKNTLIVDAYNANPTSMEAALNNFASVVAERKVAMLGDMLELGEESVVEHIQVVRKALVSGIDLVCFVGGEFAKAVDEVRAEGDSCDSLLCFTTSQELADWLAANPITDTVVLIKGSRGTRMEKVITVL
jgi:UDP-N-acetylmuramoyl-tripeptide--D-alanyl-D-alanine ligase